jgi:putative phosphonate metabolism protein
MRRFAVYYAPAPGSPLHSFGTAWLGRNAEHDVPVTPPPIAGMTPERRQAITAAPRRYGFHATLKPPFPLAAGHTIDELQATCAAFAAARPSFEVPGLELAEIGKFLAFVLRTPSDPFAALAEDAVRAFEPFRAAPSAMELARRHKARLNARERELLDVWGYPYVLDCWRFHLTLTEELDDAERAIVRPELERLVAPFVEDTLRVDSVALFEQPDTDQPFRQLARFPFAKAAALEVGA